MSVINDMLKDLDSRRGEAPPSVPVGGGQGGHPHRRGRRLVMLILIGLVLAGLVGLGYWFRADVAMAIDRVTSDSNGNDGQATDRATASSDPANPVSDSAGDSEAEADSREGRPDTDATTASAEGDSVAAAPEPNALQGLRLERGDNRLMLQLQLSGDVTPRHEVESAAGTLRLPDTRIADGVTVPPMDGELLRSMALAPTSDGIRLDYRTADDARAAVLDIAGGTDQVTLAIRRPPDSSASRTTQDASEDTNKLDQTSRASTDEPTDASAPEQPNDGSQRVPTAEVSDTSSSAVRPPEAPEASGPQTDQASSGEARAAAEAGEGTISRQRRAPSSAEQADAAYRQALEALEGGDTATAEKALRQGLAADTAHAPSRRALAMIMLRGGRPAEASEVLRAGFENGVRNPTLVALYARSWLERGNLDKAVAIMEQGREMVSVDAEYMATLAGLYQQQGHYDDAVSAYQAALERRRGEASWWAGLGIALENRGDTDQALQAYEQALSRGGLSDSLASYVRQRIGVLE